MVFEMGLPETLIIGLASTASASRCDKASRSKSGQLRLQAYSCLRVLDRLDQRIGLLPLVRSYQITVTAPLA
jgi:hypothetical protein